MTAAGILGLSHGVFPSEGARWWPSDTGQAERRTRVANRSHDRDEPYRPTARPGRVRPAKVSSAGASSTYQATGRTAPSRPQLPKLAGRGAGGGGGGRSRTGTGGGGRFRRLGRVRAKRLLVLVLVGLLVLTSISYLWANAKVNRIEALTDYEGRPDATPGTDWLLVGSDSREGLTSAQRRELHTGAAAGKRTDTMMLVHIPAGSGSPVLVSLPRDSYVPIPGHGSNKLNAAYAIGGPKLLARTVEQVTGIRLDHYAEIGFGGFAGMVDALGGVELCPRKAIRDAKAHIDLPAGCQELDGVTALGYVRARYFDGRGDIGRMERQQEFMAALMKRATTVGTLANPFALKALADASLAAVEFDEGFGLLDGWGLLQAMRSTGSSGTGVRLTVPISNPDYRPGGVGSAVRWDRERARELFGRIRDDRPVTASEG